MTGNSELSNRELLNNLKVEIGWLRNELVRMRNELEEQTRQLADLQLAVRRSLDD